MSMAFVEDVEVLLLTESHVVEHIKGVELESVSDKLIAHTETEFKNLHTHKKLATNPHFKIKKIGTV